MRSVMVWIGGVRCGRYGKFCYVQLRQGRLCYGRQGGVCCGCVGSAKVRHGRQGELGLVG